MMPRRPPKKWFYATVKRIRREAPEVDDPEALAGWLWHHHMKPRIKRSILRAERQRKGGKKKMGKKRGKKWGKIGAPRSAKRRRWLTHLRRKRRR